MRKPLLLITFTFAASSVAAEQQPPSAEKKTQSAPAAQKGETAVRTGARTTR